LTRENTIRSRLLFKEGDVYKQSVIDETGRILRGMGIIGDIEIICDTLANNFIDITVITNDKWTLGFNTSFKQDGGITNFSIKLKENNLLGNAQSISLGYNYSSDRINPWGFEGIFRDPYFFSTWWDMKLQYKKNEHLDIRTFLLERPYYSDSVNWSLGMYFDLGMNRSRIFENGVLNYQYDIKQENQSIWYALRPNIFNKTSVGIGYFRTRTDAEFKYLKPYDNKDLVIIYFDFLNRDYYTTSFIENFGRIEDIPKGNYYNLSIGKNLNFTKSSLVDYYYRISWLNAFRSFINWYVSYRLDVSGYLVNGKHKDILINCNFLQHQKISERNLLVLRSIALLGYNWSYGNQMILGSQEGLRGYPAYAFSGNQKLLF
jgi:outer membrane protein assembly factor BamA